MEIIIKLSKELQVKIGEITEISNSMLNNTLELKNNSDLLVKQIFDSI